jgi:RNA 2',3'-cyclic 3'-phosphodiesterase
VARLFVAVWPPPEVVSLLAALPRYPLAGARWTTEKQWHVTLRFLGACDERAAVAALDRVAASPCTAVLGPGPRRLGRDVLVVPVAGLDELAAAVAVATDGLGGGGRFPYRGHLTLARASRGEVPRMDAPVVASWAVDRVALVESQLHPAGARYTTVHERRLA